MRKIISALTLVILLIVLSLNSPMAADHYVRAGASGNGSDWTNAYGVLPATLVRGDTYYLADGDYGSYAFNDAENGTLVIIIRKATASDHGINTGWDTTYGDGKASFSGIAFSASYYEFNGGTGGGPGNWNSGFGFEITRNSTVFRDNGDLVTFTSAVGNIAIRHVHLYSGNKDFPLNGIKGIAGASNLVIAYNSIHTIYGVCFHIGNWRDVAIEYNYLADNKSTPEWHTEGISSIGTNQNITIRHNVWDRIQGTAVIAGVNSGASTGWKIYGNIFSRSMTTIAYYYESGSNKQTMNDLEFYNNNVVNMPGVSQGGIFINQGTNNKVFNNIWYNNIANSFSIDAAHDYNYFAENRRVEGCTPTPCDKDAEAAAGETAPQIGTGSPLVNGTDLDPLNGDFHLKAATNPGTTLVSPFNIDLYDAIRGGDGVWDRGACEYTTGSDTKIPAMSMDKAGAVIRITSITSSGVSFILLQESNIRLDMYDFSGKQILSRVNGHTNAGKHSISLNMTIISNGIYFVKLSSSEDQVLHTMRILR